MGKVSYRWVRYAVLASILAWVTWTFYMHVAGGNAYPSVHAICPIGGLESLWSFLAGQSTLQKIFTGTIVLFWFTALFALLFNRAFCGNICPFGALQELLGKINPRKFQMPKAVDKPLRYLKYVVLVFITVMAWYTATLFIAPYDPWTAYAHLFSPERSEYIIGLVILVVVLVGSVLYDRFFCKYLCPAGALYGIIGKISPTRISVTGECTHCGRCNKACIMNVEVCKMDADRDDTAHIVRDAECILCGECVTVCPTNPKATSITFVKSKINPMIFLVLSLVIFFGGLFVMDAAGWYQVTIPSIEDVQEKGEHISIDTLRGSMTIEEGAAYSGFDLAEFYAIMEIPETVPSVTRLKEVQTYVPGYDFHVIKAKQTGVKGK